MGVEEKDGLRVVREKYESKEFLGRVAARMYEGVSWQDAVRAESPEAWARVCVRWKTRLPAVLEAAQAAVEGAGKLTPARLKAMAARVLEAAEGEADLVKRATVISRVSEVLGNCMKVSKEAGIGEYDSMSLTQIQDRITRLARRTVADE